MSQVEIAMIKSAKLVLQNLYGAPVKYLQRLVNCMMRDTSFVELQKYYKKLIRLHFPC